MASFLILRDCLWLSSTIQTSTTFFMSIIVADIAVTVNQQSSLKNQIQNEIFNKTFLVFFVFCWFLYSIIYRATIKCGLLTGFMHQPQYNSCWNLWFLQIILHVIEQIIVMLPTNSAATAAMRCHLTCRDSSNSFYWLFCCQKKRVFFCLSPPLM